MDNDSYLYSEDILRLINNVVERSKSMRYPLLAKRIDFIQMLFNQYVDYPITNQVYDLVWRWVNEMTVAGAEDWMKQYWNYANQFYMFNLSHSGRNEEMEMFREFHVMVCSMMLYNNRYEWLKHALFLTSTLPPSYPLIPSTFRAVFATYVGLLKKNERFYLMRYSMKGMNLGAGEDSAVEGELLRYISLLMIRLFSVNDYNITFSDPMALPEQGRTIEENRRILSQIDVIIQHVNQWRKERTVITKRCGLDIKGLNNALELLNNYKNSCENRISEIENNPIEDSWKRNRLKEELIDASNKLPDNLRLPSVGDKNLPKEDPVVVSQEYRLNKELILKGYDYVGSGLADIIIDSLILQLRNSYNYLFLANSPCKTYVIPYELLGKAMKRLCLSNAYVILAQGVSPHLYEEINGFQKNKGAYSFDGAEIIEVAANSSCFLIMKRSDVPSVERRELSEKEKQGLLPLGTNDVYTNIDSIAWPDPLLEVCQKYVIKQPDHLRYIRMRIDYRLAYDETVVDRIENIKKTIV